jgi:DNA polymerase-3 subunit delta'
MQIIGHQKKLAQLQNLLNRNFIFPALLFEGPEKVGKFTIAKEFIKGWRCDKKVIGGCHQCQACLSVDYDLMVIDKDLALKFRQKELEIDPYGIDGIGQVLKFVQTTPIQFSHKIILIDNAHLLTFEAQNKLLKTLEEPPQYCLFILVSHKPESLLPTIRSRCLTLNFNLVPQPIITDSLVQNKIPLALAKTLAQYSFGRPGQAIDLSRSAKNTVLFKNQALAMIKFQGITFPEQLLLIPGQNKAEPEPLFPLIELFQVITRDSLLFSWGVGNQSILLTKKPLSEKKQAKLKALRESFRLAEIIENAVSPMATTRCFEYLAIKMI